MPVLHGGEDQLTEHAPTGVGLLLDSVAFLTWYTQTQSAK
jgi:hypothetical protein